MTTFGDDFHQLQQRDLVILPPVSAPSLSFLSLFVFSFWSAHGPTLMVHGMVATVSGIFVNSPRALSALLSFSPRSLSSSPELADAIRRLQTLKTTKSSSKTRVGAEFARVVKRTRRDEEKTKRGQRAQSDKIQIKSRLIRRSERQKMTSFGRLFGAPGDNFRSTWREPRAAKLGSLANDRPEPGDLRKPLEFSKTSLVVIRDDFRF